MKQFLYIAFLMLVPMMAAGQVEDNPLDGNGVYGPVRKITTYQQKQTSKKAISAEQIIKKNANKNYSEVIYDSLGRELERGRYESKAVKSLVISTPSQSSLLCLHGIRVNNKRQQKDDWHQLTEYTLDGAIRHVVYMMGSVILTQNQYEYDANGHLTAVYTTQGDNLRYLQKTYEYNPEGQLISFRYYYQPDSLSFGYTLHYSDSLVVKKGFWGNPEGKGEPEQELYYLDEEGRVIRSIKTYGQNSSSETLYSGFDRYGNWTESTVTLYNGAATKLMLDEFTTVYIPGDRKQTTRIVRVIEYSGE